MRTTKRTTSQNLSAAQKASWTEPLPASHPSNSDWAASPCHPFQRSLLNVNAPASHPSDNHWAPPLYAFATKHCGTLQSYSTLSATPIPTRYYQVCNSVFLRWLKAGVTFRFQGLLRFGVSPWRLTLLFFTFPLIVRRPYITYQVLFCACFASNGTLLLL